MKKYFVIVIILFCFSCQPSSFCGSELDKSQFNATQSGLDEELIELTMKILFDLAEYSEELSKVKMEYGSITKETANLIIKDIPNEKLAMKVSCVVSKSDLSKSKEVIKLKLSWDDNHKYIIIN